MKKIEKMSERECKAALHEAVDVIGQLMESHKDLLPGMRHIACNVGLANDSRIAGTRFLEKYS